VADQGEPGRKAQDSRQKGRMRMKFAPGRGSLGQLERKEKKEGKERAMDDATFLYSAKAAAGLCTRLARNGGRGFRMRTCRLILY
jgi:hypothetical protein